MIFHVLNGDALTDRFLTTNLGGEMVITRECLVEGNVKGDTLPEFWRNRARYLSGAYQEEEETYFQNVVPEFNKLINAPDHSEYNLWFGYDLFCQSNMWFVISLLHDLAINKEIYVVYPSFLTAADIWKDFGTASTEDLKYAFQNRVRFSPTDLTLGKALWLAYKDNDLPALERLSAVKSPCFPYLENVCRAHIDRFPAGDIKGRPERAVEDIFLNTATDFYTVYNEFFKREGVYGFGDLQVKHIYDKLMQER